MNLHLENRLPHRNFSVCQDYFTRANPFWTVWVSLLNLLACFMNSSGKKHPKNTLANILLPKETKIGTRPVWFARAGSLGKDLEGLTKDQRGWLHSTGWQPSPGNHSLLPGKNGELGGVVMGLGAKADDEYNAFLVGGLPKSLPPGAYHFESQPEKPLLATIAWLMGCYSFSRYNEKLHRAPRHLLIPDGADMTEAMRIATAIGFGRDLINTPANDLGPAELEEAARHLAESHGGAVDTVVGDDLLEKNFPLIHAVGRASDRAPRLIDLTWGDADHPKVTLVGKGICFDTGGLNLKPGNSMILMKKDMGGAATALTLGAMIMSAALPVRLRILIPAADNNISANAFRPSDIIRSRKGLTVEIGNTDAEGRLVLADALALADEEKPDLILNFATLTGAARAALGPDLPALYSTEKKLARALLDKGEDVYDPMWQMPLWADYDKDLSAKCADVNNISEGYFAGSITAALFLKRFVTKTEKFVHLDLFGWIPKPRPGRPVGGEPQGARAFFEYLSDRYGGK